MSLWFSPFVSLISGVSEVFWEVLRQEELPDVQDGAVWDKGDLWWCSSLSGKVCCQVKMWRSRGCTMYNFKFLPFNLVTVFFYCLFFFFESQNTGFLAWLPCSQMVQQRKEARATERPTIKTKILWKKGNFNWDLSKILDCSLTLRSLQYNSIFKFINLIIEFLIFLKYL